LKVALNTITLKLQCKLVEINDMNY
jgi:hypothetical protein